MMDGLYIVRSVIEVKRKRQKEPTVRRGSGPLPCFLSDRLQYEKETRVMKLKKTKKNGIHGQFSRFFVVVSLLCPALQTKEQTKRKQ